MKSWQWIGVLAFAALARGAAAQAYHPGKLFYGSPGNGSIGHLAAELLIRAKPDRASFFPAHARHRAGRRIDSRSGGSVFRRRDGGELEDVVDEWWRRHGVQPLCDGNRFVAAGSHLSSTVRVV